MLYTCQPTFSMTSRQKISGEFCTCYPVIVQNLCHPSTPQPSIRKKQNREIGNLRGSVHFHLLQKPSILGKPTEN